MKRHFTILETLLRYRQIMFILVGTAVAFGVVALVVMPRDEYPEFTIRQGLIIGVMPGASSEQVEEQLTTKVENYLFQYKSVNRAKTYSVSKENVMVVYVDVSSSEKDPDAFWAKLRHGLNELKSQLPSSVMSLTADNDFGNTSALLIAVESDTRSYRELENYITEFENDVRRVPSVSRVKHYGLQKEQISVYIDEARLATYAIKPIVVMAALKPQGAIGFAGEVDDGSTVRPIHIPSTFASEEDVANQIVYSDPLGNAIRVRDVARVVREYPEEESFIRSNGHRCVVVSLEMMPGNNIVRFGDEVQSAVQRFSASLPQDVTMATITDMPSVVSTAIRDFLKEFGIAIVVVILVTMLLLPRRVALVAASSIPVSILITLGIMWMVGISLQTVSLAVLIVVLGMVVDNAIVIVDSYVDKLDHDITPQEAASSSVHELFGSVFSATLIIIVSFAPIPYFMGGTGGDFTSSIPSTISIALGISLLVAVLVVPVLCFIFIKAGIRRPDKATSRPSFLDRMQAGYDALIAASFRNKRTVVLIGAASFIVGLLLLGTLPQQSFPKIERNQFAVEVTLPTGSSLTQTDRVLKTLEDTLLREPKVKLVTAFVGTSSPRFQSLYAPKFPAKSYGQLVVVTESNEATVEILDRYGDSLTNLNGLASIKWKQLEMSPSKAPIEVRISGDSIPELKRIAAEVSDILRAEAGVTWVRNDYWQPLQSIDVMVKSDEASRLGYSGGLLTWSLMSGTRGLPVGTVWEGDYPLDVQLRIDRPRDVTVEDLQNQYVTSPMLVSSVQLRQLATLQPGWTEGEIVRRNGVRTLTVSADVERGRYSADILSKVKSRIDAIPLPDRMHIEHGGDYSDSKENITPMYYSLAFSVVVIFIILMFQFRSIKTSLLIMGTLPLSIFGAAVGVAVTGYPFSTTAFIGLIGLLGIVVRNGIIYVSFAEELRNSHGYSLLDAAIAAARRRMRPIFLTSAAAAMGVVPMIMSRSSLWGPLGSVVCFGLIFGMMLSLLVMPVLYHLFHRRDFESVQEVPGL